MRQDEYGKGRDKEARDIAWGAWHMDKEGKRYRSLFPWRTMKAPDLLMIGTPGDSMPPASTRPGVGRGRERYC